jgi:hypothetical protein
MFQKVSVIFVVALLAFATACSSSSSTGASAGAVASGVVATSPSTCPTAQTKKFAKTLFVADAALAGGAFKRYIYTPAKDGKFKKGTKGRILALVKAGAAGLFVVNRLKAATVNVQNDPTLCKLLIAPVQKFTSAVSGLVSKAKSGGINPSDVDSGNSLLSQLHDAATSGGTSFTDNTNASVG